MKTNKWFILFVLLFCRCAFDETHKDMYLTPKQFGITVSPAGDCFPTVKDKYIYKIVPGTKEWQTFKSTEDAYKACQLPARKLKSMSTAGLIDALINAPMFTAMYYLANCGSEIQWRGQYQSLNSGKELFKRKDAGSALMAYYHLTSLVCVVDRYATLVREYEDIRDSGGSRDYRDVTKQDIRVSDDFKKLQGLQWLFAEEEILDKLSYYQKKEAVAALLADYEQRPDFTRSIFLTAYVMLAADYEPIVELYNNDADFQWGIKNRAIYKLDFLISFANDFINEKN